MKKRGLFLITLVLSMGFVSAQRSIGDVLEAFGGENLLLLGAFIISFALINFILGRLPFFIKNKYTGEREKTVPGIIALIISLFIVYGISTFSLSNFFFNIGISTDSLETIVTLLALGGLSFLFWKFKSLILLFLGLFLVIISIFTLGL